MPEDLQENYNGRYRAIAPYSGRPAKGAEQGEKGKPGKRTSISQKVRRVLGKRSDLLDAVRVIEDAEGPEGLEQYSLAELTNGDLVAMAVVGIALNRTGRVNVTNQLAAIQLVWAYMDGRPKENGLAGSEEDAEKKMTVEDFRAAMGLTTITESVRRPEDIEDEDEPPQTVSGAVVIRASDVILGEEQEDDGASSRL